MFTLVAVFAGIAILVGWVWLMVSGFVESVPWRVGILLFSPIGLIFGFFHWPEYKVPMIM